MTSSFLIYHEIETDIKDSLHTVYYSPNVNIPFIGVSPGE